MEARDERGPSSTVEPSDPAWLGVLPLATLAWLSTQFVPVTSARPGPSRSSELGVFWVPSQYADFRGGGGPGESPVCWPVLLGEWLGLVLLSGVLLTWIAHRARRRRAAGT